ncbi:hypothetical protein [Seonamhaeicola marinus]|uniref:Uncharacterized protein n=1 Tax=Seonamhaeicola marinus TaxID=1912246 RepID=A0A5D0HVT0_9FLAO|nr:hypothetical protein [Seonamhaeicola marinus]TYA74940.1 hypothetical protein FUA24_16710 [Seonamhaeicola marinus]
MKYLAPKMAVIIMMLLSMGVSSQETMKVSFKDLKDVFKKPSNCTYCSEAYHFVNAIQSMKSDLKRLVAAKPKKKGKIQKRLSRKLETFVKHSAEEWRGLSIELQNSSKDSEARKSTVKLQLHLESIQEALYPPELGVIESVRTSLERIKELHKTISETLKH